MLHTQQRYQNIPKQHGATKLRGPALIMVTAVRANKWVNMSQSFWTCKSSTSGDTVTFLLIASYKNNELHNIQFSPTWSHTNHTLGYPTELGSIKSEIDLNETVDILYISCWTTACAAFKDWYIYNLVWKHVMTCSIVFDYQMIFKSNKTPLAAALGRPTWAVPSRPLRQCGVVFPCGSPETAGQGPAVAFWDWHVRLWHFSWLFQTRSSLKRL